jgi:hypothetical protein
MGSFVDPVKAQVHVVQNAQGILPKVNEVGESIPCVIISTKALETAPD